VRGVFRTALPIHPSRFPRQFVPTTPVGVGVADKVAALLPNADEAVAVREFASALGVAPAASFASLSRTVGMSLYWLGRFEVEMRDLVRPSRTCALYQAVAQKRPKRPGACHALVFLWPGLGLFVLSTGLEGSLWIHNTTVIGNVPLRMRRYLGETVESYRKRYRAAMRQAS
jgi:hypothetical protein